MRQHVVMVFAADLNSFKGRGSGFPKAKQSELGKEEMVCPEYFSCS